MLVSMKLLIWLYISMRISASVNIDRIRDICFHLCHMNHVDTAQIIISGFAALIN